MILSMHSIKTDVFPNWERLEIKEDGCAFKHLIDSKMTCIVSDSIELDKKGWRHVSISHKDRIPDYNEIKRVKELFVGKYTEGYLIFPSEDKHVNLNPHCLHIFCPIGHQPLPDFTRGGKTI